MVNVNKDSLRFNSLDVFRGLTVCFMIIVNTPGTGAVPFGPFVHSAWHGFTPTDLVFPSFLFAVGNAMSFTTKKLESVDNTTFLIKVFRRAITIFLIGFLMYWFPFFAYNEDHELILKPISETRIMGVLQRIALCYFFASLIIRFFSLRAVFFISVFLLIAYWFVLLSFGSPSDPFSMLGNAGLFIDKYVFGDKHLYHGEGFAFEPEGLLSTIPSIVNVLAGYYAGVMIQMKGKNYETITKILLIAGLLICIALAWNTLLPINKKLWTGSFVLLTVGIDLGILGTLIYFFEMHSVGMNGLTRFFTIFGKNPLFIYLLSEVIVISFHLIPVTSDQNLTQWINQVIFQRLAPGAFGSLFYAITFMLLCWSIGWWLDKRKMYIRV